MQPDLEVCRHCPFRWILSSDDGMDGYIYCRLPVAEPPLASSTPLTDYILMAKEAGRTGSLEFNENFSVPSHCPFKAEHAYVAEN